MKDKIAKLIDLKSIITLILTVALVVFTYLKILDNETFIMAVSAVFTYFFTRRKEGE